MATHSKKGDLKQPPHNNDTNGKFHINAQTKIRVQYKTKPTRTAAAKNATAQSFI
jgi:hypothetical protein